MNQHFVPRVYLKNFSRQKNNDFYIDVYDKKQNKNFEANIKKICSQKNYYNLPENSRHKTDALAVERFYSDFVEPMYAEVFKILTNDNIIDISDIQRVKIMLGVFHFYFRNPKIIEESLKVHFNNIDILIKEAEIENNSVLTYIGLEFDLTKSDSETIKKRIKSIVYNDVKDYHIDYTGKLGSHHEFGIIEVIKATDDHFFITNDCPLQFDNVLDDSHEAIFDKGADFTLPLSPEYVVKITHNKNKKPFRIYRQTANSAEVAIINSKIQKEATRFILGSYSSFQKQNEINILLDETSQKAKVDILKNLIQVVPENENNRKSLHVFKEAILAFDSKGFLTNDEEKTFNLAMSNMIREHKQNQL